jgi:GDP-L-fucose synthase
LRNGAATEVLLKNTKPELVVHLAAKVGGIIANAKYPADFFTENMLININVFEACRKTSGVKKLVTFMGGCSYPAKARSPISEDQMWEGFPQIESAPYSTAKKMLLVQSFAYRKQYGLNSIVLIPGNVYGEYDNFNYEYAHVIPAMIRRFVEAKENKAKEIICYGSGKPTRDFVYAGDVAELVPWFIKNYDVSDPINISSGSRTSIKELAETVASLTDYSGDIKWDVSKPDGQLDKIFDVSKLKAAGLSCKTALCDGLKKTIEWFVVARKQGNVRL